MPSRKKVNTKVDLCPHRFNSILPNCFIYLRCILRYKYFGNLHTNIYIWMSVSLHNTNYIIWKEGSSKRSSYSRCLRCKESAQSRERVPSSRTFPPISKIEESLQLELVANQCKQYRIHADKPIPDPFSN